MKRILTTTALALCLTAPAQAADVALIIGNEDYENAGDLRRATDVVDAAEALRSAGVNVLMAKDANRSDTGDLVRQLEQMAGNADGLLVVLSGRFLHSGMETYFLPTDSDSPTLTDLPANSLPLSTVTALLAKQPGHAILLLATDDANGQAGRYLTQGSGLRDMPQGVTLIEAAPRAAADFLEDVLATPDRSIAAAVEQTRGATARGYLPDDLTFLTRQQSEAAQDNTSPDSQRDPEEIYWFATQNVDSEAGYESYLSSYPDGSHAAEARARLEDIRAEPFRSAKQAEEALSLSRSARQEIQRDLSLLDYNTRGIDGIFGPGTRNAVSAWQRENGREETSYLTRDQITRLDAQAERRSAELEAEAEQRRAEQEAVDRAFWDETGSQGDEAGLRAYLDRHPDGLFADVAQDRLDVIESEKRDAAAIRDRDTWDRASQTDTVEAYDDYLDEFPDGAFVEDANARLSELNQDDSQRETRAEAEAREAALNLNTLTRRLIEERLQSFGLEPGPADGNFDDNSRRAIRRYQSARDLEATGFLTQDAIVRLLADSILR